MIRVPLELLDRFIRITLKSSYPPSSKVISINVFDISLFGACLIEAKYERRKYQILYVIDIIALVPYVFKPYHGLFFKSISSFSYIHGITLCYAPLNTPMEFVHVGFESITSFVYLGDYIPESEEIYDAYIAELYDVLIAWLDVERLCGSNRYRKRGSKLLKKVERDLDKLIKEYPIEEVKNSIY